MKNLVIKYCLLLYAFNGTAQSECLNFRYLGIENGLSQGYVTSIVQDSIGFMWFGTHDGLNKFDGYTFTTFYNNINDTNSISSNQITALAVDNNHQLWIGTLDGLNYYDYQHGIFRRFSLKTPTSNSNRIQTLLVDKDGLVWFSFTNDPYLNCYDPELKKLVNYPIDQNDDNDNSFTPRKHVNTDDYYPTVIFESSNHRIWLGTNLGSVLLFDKEQSRFIHSFNLNFESSVSAFVEDFDHTIWVSTFNHGFYHINPVKELSGKTIPDNINIPAGSSIFNMIKNTDGSIWIGLVDKSLLIFSRDRKKLTEYKVGNGNGNQNNYRGIYSFCIDKSGMLWCGTNGYGIFSISPYAKKFYTIRQGIHEIKKHYFSQGFDCYFIAPTNNKSINSLSFQSIRGIYADDEYIYAGGYAGLDKIDRKSGLISNIFNDKVPYSICADPADPDILWIGIEGVEKVLFKLSKSDNRLTWIKEVNCGFVFKLVFDNQGKLWIANLDGLISYDTKTGSTETFQSEPSYPTGLKMGAALALMPDHEGYLWIGSTYGALTRFDTKNKIFKHFSDKESISKILVNNPILTFFEDKNNGLWIGTAGSGLCYLDPSRKNFRQYTMINGLPNNVVYAILMDASGDLWLSTNKGISRYNPQHGSFVNFDKTDGLQDNEFNAGSYFQTKNGEIFLGGVNGISYFLPSEIDKNYFTPNIVLTSVMVENTGRIFNKPLPDIKNFVFSHNDLIISFEFAALNYYLTDKNLYKYQLKGFNEKWIDLKNEHKVTFTGLKNGNYTLNILASNNDGIWIETPLTIDFSIYPPVWKRWWFILFIITLACLGVYVVLYYWLNAIKNRSIALEQVIAQRTKEIYDQKEEINSQKITLEKANAELRKVNATKDKFFSIIGHDLRSPFNAILGFTELLEDDYDKFNEEEKKRFISNIRIAAGNTYKLLQNLLEWASSQAGIKEFRPDVFDLSTLANENLLFTRSQAQHKNIRLISTIPYDTLVFADQNMINTVFRNLVSNAIKFTNTGGEVVISSEVVNGMQNADEGGHVVVSVSDNGVGIQPDDITKLFSIDKKIKTEGTLKEQGTGLGLVICKEFIARNNGRIWAESEPGKGSRFSFTIPQSDGG